MSDYKPSSFSLSQECQSDLLKKIPNVSSSEDFIYTLEWISGEENNELYAIGINVKNNRLCKFKSPLKSHLYVWAQTFKDVSLIIHHVRYCDITKDGICKIPDKIFKCNNMTPLDELLGNDRSTKPWTLFRIPTISYTASKQLYNMINSSIAISYKIATLGAWSLETMVLMELYYHYYSKDNILEL